MKTGLPSSPKYMRSALNFSLAALSCISAAMLIQFLSKRARLTSKQRKCQIFHASSWRMKSTPYLICTQCAQTFLPCTSLPPVPAFSNRKSGAEPPAPAC